MNLRLIRHATLWIDYAGKTILVDPMFAPRGEYPGLPAGFNRERNPLVDLPCPPEEIASPDVIVVTHLHFDHLDKAAVRLLPKDRPLVCPDSDQQWIGKSGFTALVPLYRETAFVAGIEFSRTEGQHGKGIVGRLMGLVSGFVLRAPGEPCLYLAGDTVWCPEVEGALARHRPEVIVVNAGEARFTFGRAITMTAADVISLAKAAPDAKIAAVHLEAVNHCRLKRRVLAEKLERAGLAGRVLIPADGQTIDLERG